VTYSTIFNGAITINGTGCLNVTSGDVVFGNIITITSLSGFNLGGTSHTLNAPMSMTGILYWISGTILGLGSITIQNGGTLTIANPSTISLPLLTSGSGSIISTVSTTFNDITISGSGSLSIIGGSPIFNGIITIGLGTKLYCNGVSNTFNNNLLIIGGFYWIGGNFNGIGVITVKIHKPYYLIQIYKYHHR
jgi:hypothetical protein